MKKIAIVGTVGVPAKYGGFETLAQQLIISLEDQYSFIVICSKPSYTKHPPFYRKASLIYLPLKANGIQSILYDFASYFKVFRKADVLLILGVSGAILLPLLKLFSKKKIILHCDGIEWKREKWNKYAKWFLKTSEKIGSKFADFVIADNIAIKEYLFKEYKRHSILIEYGGDHFDKPIGQNRITERVDRYAFTVCRIEPENNIHLILEAFAQTGSLKLKIVGNWENSGYSRELKKKYAKYANIELIGPIYDVFKLNSLRQHSYIYLHGHSAGGTNPSLVEAMFLGLPVLAFAVDYNIYSTESKALYFSNIEELKKILQELDTIDLTTIARKMEEIALQRYTWAQISKKYRSLFDMC